MLQIMSCMTGRHRQNNSVVFAKKCDAYIVHQSYDALNSNQLKVYTNTIGQHET